VLSAGVHLLARAKRLPDAVVLVVGWNGDPRYRACFFVTPLPVRKPQAIAVGTREPEKGNAPNPSPPAKQLKGHQAGPVHKTGHRLARRSHESPHTLEYRHADRADE
jgi:hypothetical protein